MKYKRKMRQITSLPLTTKIAWKNRLAVRQAGPIVAALMLTLTVMLFLGYDYGRKNALNSVQIQVEQLAERLQRLDTFHKNRVEHRVETLAVALTEAGPQVILPPSLDRPANKLSTSIKNLVRAEPSGNDTLIMLDNGAGIRQARQYHRDGQVTDLPATALDFDLALVLDGQPHWHSPSVETKDGEMSLRYSQPLGLSETGSGLPFGVVSAKASAQWFESEINNVADMFKDSIIFFLAENGAWTLPQTAPINTEEAFSLAGLKEEMLLNRNGTSAAFMAGQSYVVIYFPIAAQGFLLGVMIPHQQLFAGLEALTRTLALLGLMIIIVTIWMLHRTAVTMLRPLNQLLKVAERLAHGDFAPPTSAIQANRNDETGQSLRAAERLRLALQGRLQELTTVLVTRERLFGELALARMIQDSLRPAHFPSSQHCRIAARLYKADNVCGDMYNFFLSTPDKLCCLIGNVAATGGGVPAALLTGRLMPLLHDLLLSGHQPDAALKRAGQVLASYETSAASELLPIVSVFAGILDLSCGNLVWAGAGQRPPFKISAGKATELPWSENVPLGISSEAEYHNMSQMLQPGEMLFFYSGRLLAATEPSGEMYGEKRLKKVLISNATTPEELTNAVYNSLINHIGPAGLADDVVLLALKWLGGNKDGQL